MAPYGGLVPLDGGLGTVGNDLFGVPLVEPVADQNALGRRNTLVHLGKNLAQPLLSLGFGTVNGEGFLAPATLGVSTEVDEQAPVARAARLDATFHAVAVHTCRRRMPWASLRRLRVSSQVPGLRCLVPPFIFSQIS